MKMIVSSILLIVITSVLFAAGCSGQKAGQMYDTAQFEELQGNQEHAEDLYRKIIRTAPESEYARQAQERLDELESHR